MAVGVFMTMPGVKQKQYEQINKKLFGHYPFHAGDAPDGLLVHSAGPAADGWYVYDIWETKDKFNRFGEQRLGPAVRETIGASYDERRPDFYEIANLVDVGSDHAGTVQSALAKA